MDDPTVGVFRVVLNFRTRFSSERFFSTDYYEDSAVRTNANCSSTQYRIKQSIAASIIARFTVFVSVHKCSGKTSASIVLGNTMLSNGYFFHFTLHRIYFCLRTQMWWFSCL